MILQAIVVVTAVLAVTAAIDAAIPTATPSVRPHVPDASDPGDGDDLTLHVAVLGPVAAAHGSQPVPLSDRLLEALTFLAAHPAGVTEGEIRTALWGDRPSTPGALRNLLWQLRRQIGTAADGEPLVAFADEHGRYRLHSSVSCDLANLVDLAGEPRMRRVLDSVRGRPFESRRGFEWAHREGLVGWAEARVVTIAEELAESAFERGDATSAATIAESALLAVPEDERLHRILLCARGSLGDRAAVERAMDRLVAIVADPEETDPWSLVERQTLDTYRDAGGRHGKATSVRSEW